VTQGLCPELARGPVETQEGVPAFARNRLHPICLVPLLGWPNPDIHGFVWIDDDVLVLAADTTEPGIRLQLRARLLLEDDFGTLLVEHAFVVATLLETFLSERAPRNNRAIAKPRKVKQFGVLLVFRRPGSNTT
jgi:hypothetical protein